MSFTVGCTRRGLLTAAVAGGAGMAGVTLASPPNAGEDGSVVVGKILDKDQYNYGFDAQNNEYGNLVSKGIIDPTKVVRTALQDAASIAGLLITTEAMVAELPKPPPPPLPGHDHDDHIRDMDF